MHGHPLSKIKHIVVLMLENRSFDNLFGYLYDPQNQPPFDKPPRNQPFEGVSGKDLTNPIPAEFGGGLARVSECTDFTAPQPNPNEAYADVFRQLYNLDPSDDDIPNPAEPPSMQGFVNNYAGVIHNYNSKHPSSHTPTQPGDLMRCFRPKSLPVICGLANAYAVCDHWFSSVPTETFPNRSFAFAGTSNGYVYNEWKTGRLPWDIRVLINKRETIFNLLENAGVRWRIYHGGSLLSSFAFLLHEQLHQFASLKPAKRRFFEMDHFWKDAEGADGLPGFSFIEPRYFSSPMFGPQNDFHPDYLPIHPEGLSNVEQGELLISQVYEALRKSPAWENTLLVVTFDEHGGCYDHVPPPAAVSPDGVVITEHPGSGFLFNRLGVRVPAVLISPFIEAGTVCNTVFDHTSIIKTVINCFDLKDAQGNPATLLEREKAANDLSEVLTLSQPRTDAPAITPLLQPHKESLLERPLNIVRHDILGLATHHVANWLGEHLDYSEIETTEHVADLLKKKSIEVLAKIHHT
jgi:phospholipase C